VWTSLAHLATFGILLARTDPDAPKHRGISYFVCPMRSPGVEIRPLVEMTGEHTFNEVTLEGVRLPAGLLVGEEHQGWALAKVTLANERVSLSTGGALWGAGPSADDLLAEVRRSGPVADPVLRQRLAGLAGEAEVLDLVRQRTLAARVRGEQPGPEASVRKVLADEHGQHLMGLAKDLAGAAGMLADHGCDPGPRHHGFLFAPALTIGGGTGEVQRNVIAERALGLPRDADPEAGVPWSEARRARGRAD
jgi:alkylation response protein AidB-like acyl-CoA dehydrogenase